jgi:nitrous oxidase accessory protein
VIKHNRYLLNALEIGLSAFSLEAEDVCSYKLLAPSLGQGLICLIASFSEVQRQVLKFWNSIIPSKGEAMKEWMSLLAVIALAVLFLAPAVGAVQIDVNPGESIQAAVDAAKPGDMLLVHAGIYRESLNITRRLSLVGEGGPMLDAGARGDGLALLADGIEVSGMDIRTTRMTGILVASGNNTIRNNSVSGSLDGIRLVDSGHNMIAFNDVNNNTNGITLICSRRNIIKNNSIKDNSIGEESDCGIFLAYSQENIIQNNDLENNGDCSISLRSSSNNSMLDNSVLRNDWHGIALTESSDHNILMENNASNNKAAGLYLDSSRENSIMNNTALGNAKGIYLAYDSNDNLIGGNSLFKNGKGLYLAYRSSNNTLEGNIIANNGYGIYLTFSSGWNLIFENRLANNVNNAYDLGLSNRWDDGRRGNYYSDLGQVFYIPGGSGVDRHPMRAES